MYDYTRRNSNNNRNHTKQTYKLTSSTKQGEAAQLDLAPLRSASRVSHLLLSGHQHADHPYMDGWSANPSIDSSAGDACSFDCSLVTLVEAGFLMIQRPCDLLAGRQQQDIPLLRTAL